MLEAFLVTFREGMEAFLLVFIMIAYLRKVGRTELIHPIYVAFFTAILASFGLAYAMEHYIDNQEAAEGVMAMVASALVITLTVHMLKAAKTLKEKITKSLDKAAQKEGIGAIIGVFLFTMVMITREGMEIALFLGALSYQNDAHSLTMGALGGVAAAIALGYAWVKYSHLINIGRFLQVTAVFLILFACHMFMYGFHELTEAGSMPLIDNLYWHEATEFIDSHETAGMLITYSIILIPMAWLGFAALQNKRDKNAG